jgi:crossover junction endodeoxyribonuclease RuvC
MSNSYRILGIDPGSRLTGYGVIEVEANKYRYVDSGKINLSGEIHDRLREIFFQVGKLIELHQPNAIGIEKVFIDKNVDSAMKLGQARSAAICASFNFNIPIYEYSPREIKKGVAGHGNADKQQIQKMVSIILSTTKKMNSDESDALAIAICHANHSGNIMHLR